jgi:hypothetical protein
MIPDFIWLGPRRQAVSQDALACAHGLLEALPPALQRCSHLLRADRRIALQKASIPVLELRLRQAHEPTGTAKVGKRKELSPKIKRHRTFRIKPLEERDALGYPVREQSD